VENYFLAGGVVATEHLTFNNLIIFPSQLQVLNETSLWWFERTKQIVSNAVVSAPDKNVTIAKKCSVFPVEFVGE